jgi:hypothetical protein
VEDNSPALETQHDAGDLSVDHELDDRQILQQLPLPENLLTTFEAPVTGDDPPLVPKVYVIQTNTCLASKSNLQFSRA